VPGDQYYLELWYKTAVGVTGGATGASFSISYYDANKGFLSNSSATNLNAANNSYTRATNTGTVPAGAYYVRMTIAVNSTSTGNWFFDDLYMARINESAPQLFKNTVNSATAFQIQDSSANSYLSVDTAGAAISVGYASSTTTLNGTIKVATLGAATSNAQSVCRDSSTNALISCDANTTGKPFLQGGNSFGALATLGTNDANNLQIETNGVVRATFDQSTGLYLGNGVTAAAPNNATIAATGSTTAGTAGGNLTLKGGAGASATTGSVGGSVTIQGGAAAGSGNNNGGDVLIQGGAPTNSGTGGTVTVRNLADHTSAFRIQNANASSTIFNADTVNGRVGIGGVASFSKFEVIGGDAAIYNSGNNPRLILGDSTTAGQNGYLQWDSTNDYFRIESVGTNGVKINDNFVAIGNIFPSQPLIVGNGSTNLFQINTVGVATLIGGQTADITTASAATATGLALQPGASTGASVNGPSTSIKGGDATGTTSVTGGALTLQAGSATGGSGTRTGGSVTIDAGTGATANGAITIGGTNATGVTVGKAAGTTTLNGTVKVSTVGAATANSASECRDTVTTILTSCDSTNTTGRPFLQGGNSFGATGVLGTNDANNLTIKTANVVRATFDQSNGLYLGLGVTNAAPTAFTLSATGSTTAGTAGAALTVQGGAGATTTTGSAGGNLNLAGGNSTGGSGNNAGGVVLLQGGSATNTGTAGYVLVKNTQNSATGFMVQDAISSPVFTVATGQHLVMVGTTQAGTLTTSPALLYLSDIPNNAAGNAQLTGQWQSTANWGLGPNSNSNDSTLRFGVTTGNPTVAGNGNTWSTTANINLLVAGTLKINPTTGNNSATTFQVQQASAGSVVFDVDTSNGRVGIGTAAPSTDLSFGGAANRVLGVETQGTLNAAGVNLTVRGATGNGTGAGGQVTIQGGTGGATGGGGAVFVQGGNATGTSSNGGDLTVSGGTGGASGIKGVVNIGPMVFAAATTQTFSSGGTITQANVDSFATVLVGETTTAGANVALPDPLNTTAGRTIYVTSTSTSLDFTLTANAGALTIAMRKNATATMIWNGADWTPGGADSSTTLQAAYNNTLISAGGAEIVLNNNSNTGGLTIRDNVASPITGSLLEVQSAIGTNILSVNDFSTELMTNGGAEDGTTFGTNWTALGTSTIARTTTAGQFATGQAAASITNGTTAGNGIRGNLGTNPAVSTNYLVSFTAKLASGSAFTDLRVDYTPTGAATGTQCTVNQTIVTTTWTKITCEVTTPATTVTNADILIYQPTAAGVARVFYVDNLSMSLAASAGGLPSNVQIGGGINGGQISLFTLDRSASAPVAGNNNTYLGSLYYDTTIGRIQCYESDGWGSCGSAPDNIIILTPEFAGATLNGSGIGAMTSDFCAQQTAVLNVNTSLCPSGEARNFYQWTSPQTGVGLQPYSIYVSYKLPSTFKNFSDDNTINLTARTDNTTNAVVTYEVFKSTGSAITACGTETTVTTTVNTWQTVPINGNENTTCAFGGSNTVIFKINVKAQSNANAYVGNLTFTYTNN
jgi:hypothetical protein